MANTSATHLRLYREALKAIEAVFSDTTVSQEKTKEALEDLKSDIEMKLGALRNDE